MLDKNQQIEFVKLLDMLTDDIGSQAQEKGFWEIPIPSTDIAIKEIIVMKKAEKIALMHSELSECLEAIRSKSLIDIAVPGYPAELIELADACIRIFDYCGYFELRLADAILAKHEYNSTRKYKHGKKF